jgi:spermidine synthase
MPNTRKRGHHDVGFYKLLDKYGKIDIYSTQNVKKIKAKSGNVEMCEFTHTINYQLIRLMNSHRKRSP